MDKKGKQQSDSFFKELGSFMTPYKSYYILSSIIAILGVVSSVSAYFFIGKIAFILLDFNYEYNLIILNLVLAIVFKLLYAILINVSTWISHKGAYLTLADIRNALTKKMMNLPLGYFETQGSGRLKTLLVDHVESMEKTLAHMLPELTANLLAPLVCMVWMFVVDWRLALCSVIWVMLGMSVSFGMMRNYEEKYQGSIKANKNMNQAVTEFVNGIEVIKNFGREEESYKKYSDAVMNHGKYNVNWQKETQIYSALGMAIAPFSLFPVLIMGLILFSYGTITSGSLFMVIILTFGIFMPLLNSMSYFDQLAGMGTNAKEINSVLKYPELIRGTKEESINREVEFQNVNFSYSGDNEKALNNVSFKVKDGQMMALTGASGSGKSTIAKLIAGYWDADSGTIKIGGYPIKDYTQDAINKLIAYVDQETFLFDKSIADNIRTGKPDASIDEVISASKKAGCHQFISSLENGYDTLAGECGNKLSGGEKQRIAIARAIIKDSPIIILDEATASTDPENEATIQMALSQAVKGKTLIVVAHRLSTIINADIIAFVKEGKILCSGTHNELLSGCEDYRRLWDISEGKNI